MLDFIARGWLALWRFNAYKRDRPVPDRCVVIAAPHTSNWDLPLTLALARVSGVHLNWLGKTELFRGPMGTVMRRLGGIAVKRDAAAGVVAELVAEFAERPAFCLLVPAEGTRSKSAYWKSGFYRIAQSAEVPMLMAFIDRTTRTGGFGPALASTGDVRADMDVVRAFYADKVGLRPGRSAVPRLREEDRSL